MLFWVTCTELNNQIKNLGVLFSFSLFKLFKSRKTGIIFYLNKITGICYASDSLQVIQAKLPSEETYCLRRQDLPKQRRNQTLALLLFWLWHEKDMHKIAFNFSNKNWKSNAKAASFQFHIIEGWLGQTVTCGPATQWLYNSKLKPSVTTSICSSGPGIANMMLHDLQK